MSKELENKFDVRNTRTGGFTEDLKKVLQAHQELHKEGLVGGVAHISLDTTDATEGELPRGMVMLYDRNAKLNPSDIPNTLGQYLMVAELMPRPQGYTDADFHSEEARRALNENIPQFNEDAPSYDLRHQRTNEDIDAWGPELGQEDGVVGIYKVMEPNGRDARYYLGVKSSIPEVVQKFKQDLARTPSGPSGGGMTFGDLMDDKRLHYVDYMGRRNGYKLMYAAMKALGVAVPHGVDGDHYVPAQKLHIDDDATAKPMRAEPEHVHAITTIEPIIQGGHERVAVYNGLAPSHQCGEKCFTYVSPYDGIVRFNMNGRNTGLALPVVTGRRTLSSVNSSSDDILKRAKQSSIIWEQSAKHPAHPDLHPEGHFQVDKEFLRSMQQSGWSRENERDLMIPVLLKISNPALRRPSRDQGTKGSK